MDVSLIFVSDLVSCEVTQIIPKIRKNVRIVKKSVFNVQDKKARLQESFSQKQKENVSFCNDHFMRNKSFFKSQSFSTFKAIGISKVPGHSIKIVYSPYNCACFQLPVMLKSLDSSEDLILLGFQDRGCPEIFINFWV